LLTYPKTDLAITSNFERKIHIESGDRFANGTACLTADRASNCHFLTIELALMMAFQVLASKSKSTARLQ